MLTSALTVTVTACDTISSGVKGLHLTPAHDTTLPTWEPGAHIDVVLPSGLVRQYSLCGPVGKKDYQIAVLREQESRGGSLEVHDGLSLGDQLQIVGPRNRFPLKEASSYVFVAGGIGITPIIAMIRDVERRSLSWRLVYGGRSRESMAFLSELEKYGRRVHLYPEDECGLIDLETELRPESGALVYCCGPEPLLEAVTAHCDQRWPPDALNIERFTTDEGVEAVGADAESFEVQLGSDGPILEIAEDKSILHTLLDAGADVLYSCEEGTCGSCETQVLAGEPDHRDSLLSDSEREQGSMLLCVSRCRGRRLVLDVDPPDGLD